MSLMLGIPRTLADTASERITRREADAWNAYLKATQRVYGLDYEYAEPIAWGRLRKEREKIAEARCKLEAATRG